MERVDTCNKLIELKCMASHLVDEPEQADAIRARRQRDRARYNKEHGREEELGFLNQAEGDQLAEDAEAFRQLM